MDCHCDNWLYALSGWIPFVFSRNDSTPSSNFRWDHLDSLPITFADVDKLYPSIPISKALELIECLLKCKPNLKETTTFSVNSIMKLLRWIFALTYKLVWAWRHTILPYAESQCIVGKVVHMYRTNDTNVYVKVVFSSYYAVLSVLIRLKCYISALPSSLLDWLTVALLCSLFFDSFGGFQSKIL